MSDDLVKRWDDYVESMGCVMGEVEHTAQQMRDRIEELEEALALRTNLHGEATHVIGELEAKLAKAVEFIQDLTGCEWPYCEDAKDVLAELKGQDE